MGSDEGIAVVAACPDQFGERLGRGDPRARPAPGVWSPAEYTWHLVDVLRIGTERLWTLSADPGSGIPCFDENALAEARHYPALSAPVALVALRQAAATWCDVARSTPPGAATPHPEWGSAGASTVIRRNAHEAHHHALDLDGPGVRR